MNSMSKRKRILKLESEIINTISESGMDYKILDGEINILSQEILSISCSFLVRSNGYALPYWLSKKDEDNFAEINCYTFDHLYNNELSDPEVSLSFLDVESIPCKLVSVAKTVNLPPGYIKSFGAHQLLGQITISNNLRVFRFTLSQIDYRYNPIGTLMNKTYLTPVNERQFVNSGFGAVGRYALPLPLPASYIHDYTLPAGTKLLVGTVAPQFGQAGGGVEIMTTSDVSNVVCNGMTHIDDF